MSHELLSNLVREEQERWKADHVAVMNSYDRADSLAEGASLMQYLLGRIERLCAPPDRENIHKMNMALAENSCALHELWYTGASSLWEAISESEQDGFSVEGAEAFHASVQRVGLILPELIELRRRVRDLRAGRGVALKDALNGMGSRATSGSC